MKTWKLYLRWIMVITTCNKQQYHKKKETNKKGKQKTNTGQCFKHTVDYLSDKVISHKLIIDANKTVVMSHSNRRKESTRFWLVFQSEENTLRKTFFYNWRSFHWSDPSDQPVQQWRCFLVKFITLECHTKIIHKDIFLFPRNTGSCHKEEWGLYWRPVKTFCKINNFVHYNKDCAELLKSPSYVWNI